MIHMTREECLAVLKDKRKFVPIHNGWVPAVRSVAQNDWQPLQELLPPRLKDFLIDHAFRSRYSSDIVIVGPYSARVVRDRRLVRTIRFTQ